MSVRARNRGERPMARAYATENTHERQRLRTLVARLSDEDLTRPLPNGWTVAITLAHLAFWDRQRLALLRRWERDGVTPARRMPTPSMRGCAFWPRSSRHARRPS
jgi:hypothetical protein